MKISSKIALFVKNVCFWSGLKDQFLSLYLMVLIIVPVLAQSQTKIYDPTFYRRIEKTRYKPVKYQIIVKNFRDRSVGKTMQNDSTLRSFAGKRVVQPKQTFDEFKNIRFIIPTRQGIVLYHKKYPESIDDVAGILMEVTVVKPLVTYYDRYPWHKFILGGDTLFSTGSYSEHLHSYSREVGDMNMAMDKYNQRFMVFDNAGGSGQIIIIDTSPGKGKIRYISKANISLDYQCSGLDYTFYYDNNKKAYYFNVGSTNPGYIFQGYWDGEFLEYSVRGEVLNKILYVNERDGVMKTKEIVPPWYVREIKRAKEKLMSLQKIVVQRSWKGEIKQAYDKKPEFSGGKEAFQSFIVANMRYPEEGKNNKFGGHVIVKCTLTPEGALKDFSTIKNTNTACDLEAIRLVKLFPKWKPAEFKGEALTSELNISICFTSTYFDLVEQGNR